MVVEPIWSCSLWVIAIFCKNLLLYLILKGHCFVSPYWVERLLPSFSKRVHCWYLTSRDRPKSAPYPRLKNSKKTSKCQVFSFTVLENQKFYEKNFSKKLHTEKNGPSGAPGPLARAPSALKGGHFRNCQHFCRSWRFCRKTSKNWRREKFLFSEKISQCRKNWKGGPFGIFQHSFCRKTAKKWRGTLWGKKIPEKVSQCRKKLEGGMVCYAGKQEKPFWFSSLDQIVHFGAIIFCRTFVELFWSVRVDWKKRKATIIVALHFMKRRLKIGCIREISKPLQRPSSDTNSSEMKNIHSLGILNRNVTLSILCFRHFSKRVLSRRQKGIVSFIIKYLWIYAAVKRYVFHVSQGKEKWKIFWGIYLTILYLKSFHRNINWNINWNIFTEEKRRRRRKFNYSFLPPSARRQGV